jgi:hypothetical protein
LYAISGLFEAAIRFSPEVALRTVKGVYSLFDHTQNWIRVRTLKLASSLIRIEPRLAKKLEQKIFGLLASANAKSVECELVRLCISHYLNSKELFPLVKGKAEVFAEASDINLSIIGFQALRKMLEFQPSLLKELSEQLSLKAKIEHPGLANEIFSIYQEHLTSEDIPDFLKRLSELLTSSTNSSYKEVLANCAIKLASRKPGVIISWEYFINNLFVQIAVLSRTQEQENNLVELINILEDNFDKIELALHYQAILKQRRPAPQAPASTLRMTQLVCERAAADGVDGDWLTLHAGALMLQGEVVASELLGARLVAMGEEEVQEGVCSEIGYLMSHPAARKEVLGVKNQVGIRFRQEFEIEVVGEDDPIWNVEIELDENEIQILTKSMEEETNTDTQPARLKLD